MANDSRAFWMVWNVSGRAPTVPHASREKAQAEAERLARANPGTAFYIMEAIGVSQKVEAVTRPLTGGSREEMPF